MCAEAARSLAALRPRRFRYQVLAGFLAVHLVTSALTAIIMWSASDRELRAQARTSARAIAEVLAEGGIRPTARIRQHLEQLTGYRLSFGDEPRVGNGQWLRVERDGVLVHIDYRDQRLRDARNRAVWVAISVFLAGGTVFVLLSGLIARRLVRPLESLAATARRIGEDGDDRPIAIVGGSYEVVRLADDLERMRSRLIHLDAERRRSERLAGIGTFTAAIAHEVRNPLSAVRLTVQMLQREHAGDDRLQVIADELERLDLLIDELLAGAKEITVDLRAEAVAPIIDRTFALLHRQAHHHGVRLQRAGEEPVWWVDPRRLQQILLNLILNAIQAQEDGGWVQVLVAAEWLEVRDGGPGVPQHQVERLFAPFESGRAEGTGLGLHLAARLAEAMDARLYYHEGGFRLAGLRAGSQG